MIKMVVSDMDGTLLRNDFSLSKVNIQAIKELKAKDIVFLPASGRCYKDIVSIFEPYGIECGAIEINGAQVRKQDGSVLCTRKLPEPELKKCIAIIEDMDLSLQIFTDDGCYAYQDAFKLQKDMDAVISRNMRMPANIERFNTINEITGISALKLELMSLNEEKLEACQRRIGAFSNLTVTSSVRGNLEITSRIANKGDALIEVLKHYGINKDEVIIFGDSMNDSALFERFPNTIAVKNAVPYIKSLTREICGACDEDGVGLWLKEHLCN